jgi:hypothetical protein
VIGARYTGDTKKISLPVRWRWCPVNGFRKLFNQPGAKELSFKAGIIYADFYANHEFSVFDFDGRDIHGCQGRGAG